VYLRREYVSPMYDLDPPQIAACVHNTSQQPVYDLRFGHLVGKPCFIYDGRIMSLTPYVMPGAEERGIVDVPADKRPGKSMSRPPSATAPEPGGAHGRTASSRRYPSQRM
jgi:hypothetical protein